MSLVEVDPLLDWFATLERRHLATLSFADVRRALQALSTLYVERRGRIASGAVLRGAGKRAAFALFYGPLHFLLVREMVRALGAASPAPSQILDLGSGIGSGGAAWALEAGGTPRLLGVDRNPWAVEETRWTYRTLGLRGEARRADVNRVAFGGKGCGILVAFTVNEVQPSARQRLLQRLLDAGRRGASVLVIEPIARRLTPWWEEWSEACEAAGGRVNVWRFPVHLAERLRLLDRAAGLDHRELTGRSLWLA